jgi:hypothetical protein
MGGLNDRPMAEVFFVSTIILKCFGTIDCTSEVQKARQ